jgi:DNA replication licensing factor MCM3
LQKQQIIDTKRYCFDLNAFRTAHSNTAQDVIKHPQRYYKLIKNHLDKANHQEEPSRKYEIKKDHYSISFSGNLGSNFVTPRGLGSKFANELVGIQGIITKMDITKYYLEKSVHWCQVTKGYEYK